MFCPECAHREFGPFGWGNLGASPRPQSPGASSPRRLNRYSDWLEHQARLSVCPAKLVDACKNAGQGYLVAQSKLLFSREPAGRENFFASSQLIGICLSHSTGNHPQPVRHLSTTPVDGRSLPARIDGEPNVATLRLGDPAAATSGASLRLVRLSQSSRAHPRPARSPRAGRVRCRPLPRPRSRGSAAGSVVRSAGPTGARHLPCRVASHESRGRGVSRRT
jgi:hypothetical protein